MKTMKTKMMMGLALLTLSCTNAQETKKSKEKEVEIPAIVKENFAKKYPTAKVESWEKEDVGYEASFVLNKVESSAVFDNNGTFLEVEQEIKTAELPKTISDYCTKEYTGYKLSEAAKITDANGKLMFEAEMGNGKEHFDVLFDDKGNFVKKLDVKSEKDEDED